ncbi:MAG: B12-binding domain-containing radical SAM protein [Winogradskyella sp.]|uniref:B12-binding domain-containing radical SAM protein n=1 Tax=Winogradskyella sp. TaxID=1883156 RepID=UPI0025FDD97D|nr:radical SAM protein [Winogradskyella sp.]NRB84368.1 B12-binding domain-containing radical SAM protein [Winogradskyella sp.]
MENKKTIILYNPKAVFYTMPLALLAIGSYLDSKKYNIVIVDGRLEKDPMIKIKTLLQKSPICFATTVLTGNPIKDALKISRAVKKELPDLPVIWGGWHPSLFPEDTLKDSAVDIVVKGQGEVTFAEVINQLEHKNSLKDIKGICFKSNGVILENKERAMANINTFPPLNYDLIDVNAYMNLSGTKQLDYISSQGCRFRCSFCADPFMYNRGWFGYTPERMVDEIYHLWKKYKFNHVHFQDETFFTNKSRVKEFALELINRKLPITWFGTMRADQGTRLPEDVWELCKKSGLKKVMIGIEAGSQEMLDWMQKDIKVEQIYEVAEKCLSYNIAINFSVIVGFPDEPKESILKTIEIVKNLRKMSSDFHMGIFYFKPYPGNKIADELKEKGYEFYNTLEAWSNFDYVDSKKSEWMDDNMISLVENFKFYQKIAYRKSSALLFFLQKIAYWRIENSFYVFPFERKLKQFFMPQKLS